MAEAQDRESPREEYGRCVRLAVNFAKMGNIEDAVMAWLFAANALINEGKPENLNTILVIFDKAAEVAERGGAEMESRKNEVEAQRLSYLMDEVEHLPGYFGGDKELQLAYLRCIVDYAERTAMRDVRALAVLGGVNLELKQGQALLTGGESGSDMERGMERIGQAVDLLEAAVDSAESASERMNIRTTAREIRTWVLSNPHIERVFKNEELTFALLRVLGRCMEIEMFDKGTLTSFKLAVEGLQGASRHLKEAVDGKGMEDLAEAVDALSRAVDDMEGVGEAKTMALFKRICLVYEKRIEEAVSSVSGAHDE